jgi:hypothetical protein
MATWTGGRDVADVLESLLGSVPARGSVVYVSQPITTGPPYLRLRQALSGAPTPAADSRIRREAMAENRRRTRDLVGRVRAAFEPARPVIDPSDYENEVYQQEDFHGLWAEVVRSYTHVVVFADGWQYSTGCSVELAAALQAGLPLLDDALRPLPHRIAVGQLSDGLRELRASGLASGVMAEALTVARASGRAAADA